MAKGRRGGRGRGRGRGRGERREGSVCGWRGASARGARRAVSECASEGVLGAGRACAE